MVGDYIGERDWILFEAAGGSICDAPPLPQFPMSFMPVGFEVLNSLSVHFLPNSLWSCSVFLLNVVKPDPE